MTLKRFEPITHTKPEIYGMGGGAGLNSSQLSSMWGGAAGPRGMAGMGFNRGMMDQVSLTDESIMQYCHVGRIMIN